jgi:hypothetical protein
VDVSRHAEKTQGLTRREFTLESALAMLAGVTITVSSCGSDKKSTPTSPTPASPAPAADVSGTVSANHGHVATVTGAQITAAGALNLNIQGNATHPHMVTLSADETRQIGARQQVTKVSSIDNNHQHNVTFN